MKGVSAKDRMARGFHVCRSEALAPTVKHLGRVALAGSALGLWAAARRRRPAWQTPMGASVRAGRLAVRTEGHGPPVVLLHGLIGSGRFWGRSYDTLAAAHRLIVPDLLGFGRSDRPDEGYGPRDHAAAVVAALDHLEVLEPAVIGAHSLGCVVALCLAATYPDRVKRIVGFGPPLYPDRRAAQRRIGAAGPMAKLFVLPGPAAERACKWVCDHRAAAATVARWSHPSLPSPLADDAVEHSWRSYSETMEHCLLTGEPATWLASVAAPVEFIFGTADRVVDAAFVYRVARDYPLVTGNERPGDHRLPLTAPDWCRSRLASR